MKKIWSISLMISILSNTIIAQDVISLKENEKAPFSGILFPIDKAAELKDSVVERDYYKKRNDLLLNITDLNEKTLINCTEGKVLLLTQNDNLAKQLYSERQLSDWAKIGYFALGIVVTGIAFYGIKSTIK